VLGFPENEELNNEEIQELECDFLVPSALGHQIHEMNAGNVKAKVIVEGANGPTITEADEILGKNGVFLMPDILANPFLPSPDLLFIRAIRVQSQYYS